MSIPNSFVPFLVLYAAGHVAAQNTHTIRQLKLSGFNGGVACGVDNQRNIVGEMVDSTPAERPVLWVNGVGQALALQSGGARGTARAIGPNGDIVGSSSNPSFNDSPTWWMPDLSGGFTVIDLGVASGDIQGIANHVNVNGQSTGFSDNGWFQQAVVWPDDASAGSPVLLPTSGSFTQGEGLFINRGGTVIGYLSNSITTIAATWAWSGGTTFTLTTLPSLGTAGSWAVGDDPNGVVFGTSFSPTSGLFHVASWSGTTITDLGTIAGMDCFANAVNAGGEVVGRARTWTSPPFIAFVHRPGLGASDLNAALPAGTPWLVTDARDIADDGVIVGQGAIGSTFAPFAMIPLSVAHSAPTPGTAGVNNSVTAIGCTPSTTIFFFVALAGGETVISGCLEPLNLANPATVGTATSTGAGAATCTFFVPTALIGVPLFFQAYDPPACHTSNVVPFTF